jgi:predicted Zn-dependent peptidase
MQAERISETSLANGMSLVLMPLAGRQTTTFAVALPAGARYERDDEIGIAHLLEHLAFKGTDGHPTASALNRAAAQLGTELDGSATNDYVEFSTAVRSELAIEALDLLSEVIARPLLAAPDFGQERAVVEQEIADDEESPAARASLRLISALFHGHRLAKDTAGTRADLRQLTHQQVLAFRDRQWSPRRGVAAIAGDLASLDHERVVELLERIPDRPPPPPRPATPSFTRRVEVEEHDGDVVHLRLAYAI